MMKGAHFPATAAAFALLALATFHLVSASDPSSLQDFCVALKNTDGIYILYRTVVTILLPIYVLYRINVCEWEILQGPKACNRRRFLLFRARIAGLNTLGISLARIDYAPNGGLNPPHTHPRASEFLVVMEGTLYVGFVTSNTDNGNKLFTKVLYPGDVFVFPVGLIHFQFNIGKVKAVAIAGLSSQNPGAITIANAVFGSKPPIKFDVLTKAFQVDNIVVQYLQNQFWYDNN
ncbi:hypothetical protein ACLB2K_011669 [Fragaria x ananassa]